MKVNIYETVEVSDQQRVDIARQIDGDGAKKRQATRDEIKAFIWNHGTGWEVALTAEVDDAPDDTDTDTDVTPAEDDGDLIGETEVLGGDTVEDLI